MKVLFFGDIVGKPGRKAIAAVLPQLKEEVQPDIVIANVENIAHGKGITASTLAELTTAGIQIGTGGDHTFSKPEIIGLLQDEKIKLVRPANFPEAPAGVGQKTFQVSGKTIHVINLLGQFGMVRPIVESPFEAIQRLMKGPLPAADAILVDLHAEATSEKVAMGWYLDGKVSAVLGTHTHVPTADPRILPNGTAYVTDVGMVGLRDSSLGVDKDMAIQRFLTGTKVAFEIPEHGPVSVNAVLITIAEGTATAIERIYREIEV